MDIREGQSRLVDTMRDNPIPLALMGLGIGWLLMNGVRGSSRGSDYSGAGEGMGYGSSSGAGYGAAPDYGSSDYAGYGGAAQQQATMQARMSEASERARQLRHRAAEYGHRVQERAQEMTSAARARMNDMGRQVRTQAGHLADRSAETYHEHPLMIGSVALLIGAAIGASLPRTRNEDRLLGHTRDEVVSRARRIGAEKWEQAKEVASRTAEAARESGQQAFEQVKDVAKHSAEQAYENVRDTAKTEAERQHLTGRGGGETPGSGGSIH